MPHLHLETTADVPENADIPDILEDLCGAASNHPGIDSSKVRAYHTLRSVWVMGAGAKPAFVHLSVFLHTGRDTEWKKALGESLMSVLRRHFHMSLEAEEADLTIDLREMDKDVYQRYP